ncbi:MAG: 3-isopropylmalate dehydratase small subunit [Chloroflexi bacterium]|nr:3-isopropylmalate dehydratase small subunit [Chloroflexota bacterium]
MEPFRKHRGVLAAMNRVDVDTDQIIPKQFLKSIERTGFGKYLFDDWRHLPSGELDPNFELNRPEFQGASVLVAGRNFGCGSSREHAPWALQDYGFRAIISSSFADIFRQNCLQNGILPIELPEDAVQTLFQLAHEEPGCSISVDLERQVVEADSGFNAPFQIDPYRRMMIMQGLDEIGVTLQREDKIAAFEATRPAWLPHTSQQPYERIPLHS